MTIVFSAILLAELGRLDEAHAAVAENLEKFPDTSIEGWLGTPDWADWERELYGQIHAQGRLPRLRDRERAEGVPQPDPHAGMRAVLRRRRKVPGCKAGGILIHKRVVLNRHIHVWRIPEVGRRGRRFRRGVDRGNAAWLVREHGLDAPVTVAVSEPESHLCDSTQGRIGTSGVGATPDMTMSPLDGDC